MEVPRKDTSRSIVVSPAIINILRLGDGRLRVGDIKGASAYYARAVLVSPREPLLRLAYGVSLAEQGSSKDASLQFRTATELADNDVIAALLLQNSLAEQGASAEAQELYQEIYRRFARVGKSGLDAITSINRLRAAIQAYPDSPVYALLLGDAYQLSEQWDQADASYLSAIRLAPIWVKPRVNLGLSRLAQGKADEAIQTFESALSLDPKNVQAQLWKGDAQLRTGQNRKALMTFQQVYKVSDIPVTVASQAMTGIGRAYANTRQDTAALDSLNTAQRLAPGDPTPSAIIGDIQLRNGDVNAAVSAYDTALRITRDGGLFSQRPVLYRSLAESLLSAGKIDRAREVLTQALTEEPAQSSLWHRLLAHVALKQGDRGAAKEHLRSAIEEAPGPYPLETLRAIDAQGMLGELKVEYQKERELSTSGRFQEVSPTGIAITIHPRKEFTPENRVRSLNALAHIARYQNDIPEEISLRHELTTLRNDPWDWFLLAEIYDQRKIEPTSAREAFQKALEINAQHGGLNEAALKWARERNTALTEPVFVPK
jgi:Tfp pilus assembly protein PilF